MSQSHAILHLVELDPYHCKLVPMMLDMLRPRLAKAWSTGDQNNADAVLVDVDSTRGRQIAVARMDAGLGARTIALGGGNTAGSRALPKPLRLHALLATLGDIEAGVDLEPVRASDVTPHYQVSAWPELDPRSTSTHRLRILALLGRRPQTVADVALRLDLQIETVQPEINALLRDGVLQTAAAPVEAPAPRPVAGGRGLVNMLRQRFWL